MKKFKLLFGFLISTIVLSCSSDDNGGENQPNVKLPKKITVYDKNANHQWEENRHLEFFYNSDNTINKIIENRYDMTFQLEFQYENGYPKSLCHYTDGDSMGCEHYTYNTENQIIKSEDPWGYIMEYFYTNGRLHRITYANNIWEGFEYDSRGNRTTGGNVIIEGSTTSLHQRHFTYDNKKNPFISLSSTKMNPFLALPFSSSDIFGGIYGLYGNLLLTTNSNNMVSCDASNQANYTYVYDNDGFPIEIIEEVFSEEQVILSSKLIFEYYE